MDTKGLQKEFINWCKNKNKSPKSEDETKQLFIAFMKEKHPDEYKQAVQNQHKQQQQKAAKAAHGAKLNYFKTLKNQCPEGEEVVYFKKGGSVKCGCKKKEDGGKIAKAQEETKAQDLFKKRREEQKRQLEAEKNVPNHAPGGTNKSNRFAAEKYYRDKKHKNDYSNNKEETTPPKINKGYGKNEKGGKVNKDCGGSAIQKFKKHFWGGKLNLNKKD